MVSESEMEILISVLSSSAIAGIFVFLFKESFKAKLSIVKAKLDKLDRYQDKDYDHSFKSINDIWVAFSGLDDYLRFDFPIDISKGKIDSRSLRTHLLKIRESMALLPESVYVVTEQCLEEISREWEICAKEIVRLTNLNAEGSHEPKNLLEEANKCRTKMTDNMAVSLNNLREAYRAHVATYQVASRN